MPNQTLNHVESYHFSYLLYFFLAVSIPPNVAHSENLSSSNQMTPKLSPGLTSAAENESAVQHIEILRVETDITFSSYTEVDLPHNATTKSFMS